MDHILCHISPGEFPEQSPIYEPVGVEFPGWPVCQESLPVDILCGAVGSYWAHPLPLSMRRVAAHPRFNLCDLTDQAVFNPLLCVCQRARALMLQSNLHDTIRLFRCCQALLRLSNGPRHGLLTVEIFPGLEGVEEVSCMNMQRTGHNHCIDVSHLEQATMIVERLDAAGELLRFFSASVVDIGNCDQICVGQGLKLLEEVLSSSSNADHSHSHPVIRAEHSRGDQSCCAQSRVFHKRTSCLVRHLDVLLCASYKAPAFCSSSFIPAQL